MATAKPDSKLIGLECSICIETFTRPKLLQCLHSFCEDCLQQYASSESGASIISCPLCRVETTLSEKGVEDLKTNFVLVGLIDEISLLDKATLAGKTKVLCEQCESDNEATHRCIECSQSICPSCLKTHKRILALSTHVTASLEDIRLGKVPVKRLIQSEGNCLKHEGDVKLFYCETCEELICGNCTAIDHCKPQHNFIDYDEAARKRRRILNEMFPNFHKAMEKLQQSLATTSQVKDNFNKNMKQTKRKVQEAAAEVIAMVKAEENRLIDEIEKSAKIRSDTFEKHEKAAIDMLQRIQHSVETAKSLTETPSDWNFLSVFPIIETDMKNVTSCLDIPQIDRDLSHMKLSQTRQLVSDLDLGKVVLRDTKWQLERECGKDENNYMFYCDVCFLQTDKIAVADYKGKRIVTYNTNGNKEGVIQLNNCPNRVEAMKNQIVLVDDTAKAKVHKMDGSFAFDIPTVHKDSNTRTLINGLVLRNDMIIVGDTKRNVLTEHHLDGSLKRAIPVKTKPMYLAVDGNDGMVISGGSQCVVDVVDGNAVTLFTIKPTIKDQKVKYCSGVCCDDTDIYIAMRAAKVRSGHIHRYDGDGRFHSCVVQGLYEPVGIRMSSDGHHMAVADLRSMKLYRKV